jgi:hypothetical protein
MVFNFEQTAQAGSTYFLGRQVGVAMSVYHFVLRSPAGQRDDLGFMPLFDDRAAVAFGEAMVREMAQEHPAPLAGSVIEVTEGKRAVGSVEPDKSI